MPLRTILVCLSYDNSTAALLKSAATLARRDNAHLIGIFVTESLIIYPAIAMHIPDSAFEEFAANQRAQAAEVQAIFEAETQAETFPREWRQVVHDSGETADALIEAARCADLVIMQQADAESDRRSERDLHENVIKFCGRPVLVIPKDFVADTLGASVLVGWSDTREATRAVHDLLDVAQPDADIRVMRIGTPPANTLTDHNANTMAAALTRHGPRVEIVHRSGSGANLADLLMQEAFEMGADMMATGAFGHSRAYDFVIGAATRDLLAGANLPVLYSK